MTDDTTSTTDPMADLPPPPMPSRPWVDTLDRSALGDRRVLQAVLVLAVGFDLAVRHAGATASGATYVVMVVGALCWSRHVTSRPARAALVGVLLFAPWLVLRSSPWLLPLNVLAISGLVVAAVAGAQRGEVGRWGFRDLAMAPGRLAAQLVDACGVLASPVVSWRGEVDRRIGRVAVGLILATPLMVVVGALLAAGDDAFASLVGTVLDQGLFGHLVLAALGGIGSFALLRSAGLADAHPFREPDRHLGAVESVTLVAAVAGVYLLFAVAQVIAIFSDLGAVLADPAETSAWAREGFFQLLWASGVTLGALLLVDHVAAVETARHRRWYRSAVVALVGLTLVVVATAIYRISEYSTTFGMTLLRLYSMTFAGWVAVVFVLFGAMTWGVAADRRWFPTAVVVTALAFLLAVNIVDPEQVVARDAVTRSDGPDVTVIETLSEDGLATVAERLDEIADPAVRSDVRRIICAAVRPDRSALDWNRAVARFTTAAEAIC